MGLFKQMKDMKAVVEGSPDLIRAAQEAGVAAQQLAASQAQQIAAVQAAGTPPPAAETLAPIAGVTLERYAEVSRGLAAHAYDVTKAPMVAAGFGISASDWDIAQHGWNARITSDPAVARAFNQAYTGR
jgi:hypothetical protein